MSCYTQDSVLALLDLPIFLFEKDAMIRYGQICEQFQALPLVAWAVVGSVNSQSISKHLASSATLHHVFASG